MAVKASGIELNEISSTKGFVCVQYDVIAKYFESFITKGLASNVNYEDESSAVIKSNFIQDEKFPYLRPSIEAGFHSLLNKFVIHTHSVYANILCCCKEGQMIAEEIFRSAGRPYEWVDYKAPGFYLTLEIAKHMKKWSRESSGIFFLKNHGLIVTSNEEKECIELNQWVNEAIRKYFGISGTYPEVDIEAVSSELWKSQSTYLKNSLTDKENVYAISRNILFPDQVVFINNNLTLDEGASGKIRINTAAHSIYYACGYKEAKAFEELLIAYCFIVESIKSNKLQMCGLRHDDISYIRGMESEKHRQSMMEGMNRG
jgi:ribulose-5-phosphate 4-epimerase/fuculose-1-phosphate aldolase